MDGIKRLEKMIEGQKDKYLRVIVNHLTKQTELNQAFLNEEKNLKDMAKFIKGKAMKQANNGVAVIEDEIVFKWAEEYFIKSNEELKINKKKNKKIEEPKKDEEEFGSIFESSYILEEKGPNKTEDDIGQISLF